MTSWKKRLRMSAVCAAAILGGTTFNSHAATLTSLVGDIDGFGGQTAPSAIGVSTGADFNNTTAGDPAFTDVWQYAQSDGVGGSPLNYSHAYDLGGGTAISASLSIMESGMANLSGTWSVLFNGSAIGSIANGVDHSSTLHTFAIAPLLLSSGAGLVSLIYSGTKEGYAIDYSSLSIEYSDQVSAVPLPAALPLFGACIAVMGFFGWRRNPKAN